MILSLSHALGVSGIVAVYLIGGIVGADLAPSPGLTTLPIAIAVLGTAISVPLASAVMMKVGRRRGFSGASLGAAMASLLATIAVANGSFWLFCLSTLLLGANAAFVQQYRFAASESGPPAYAGRAVSLVLLGGLLAAFLGPEVATRARHLLPGAENAGSFGGVAAMYALASALLLGLREPPHRDAAVVADERPLREIAAQATFVPAVLVGVSSYTVMTLVMTATPLHLHLAEGFSLELTSWVIQSHIVAMYLPSLVSGLLLERLGLTRMMGGGVVALTGSLALGLAGGELAVYWAALVLLGLGWNLLFVGGTVLLTATYRSSERFKAQAVNDFAIFGGQAVASLSAGALLHYGGWSLLNLVALPLVLIAAASIVAVRPRLVASRVGD